MVFFLLIVELRPPIADIRQEESAFALTKLADYAYRECGILPCEEMLLALRKSGTPAAKLTPSGKLCLLGCATQNRRSKSSLTSGEAKNPRHRRVPLFRRPSSDGRFSFPFGRGIEDSHHSAEGAGFAYAQSAYLRREEISALIYNLAEHFLQFFSRAAYPYAKKSRSSLDGLLFSFVVPK